MAIPDYCDPRAEKYFHLNFVGSKHGEDGSCYKYSWESTSGAKETKMIVFGYSDRVCAYCGNPGLPLQPLIERHRDYAVTGYTCVCKDAMDEIEIKEQLGQLKAKHRQEESLLEEKLPAVNKRVLKAVADSRVEELKKNIDHGHFLEEYLSSFEIKIKG